MNTLMAFQVFVRVAEFGGFTAASRTLGLSVSAVTKTIARLEDQLGTQLIARTTRRMSLTEDGEALYERALPILAQLAQLEQAVGQARQVPRGRVRAVVPYSFGRVTLIPALPLFCARFPEISLDLTFSDNAVDLLADGFDLGVLTGRPVDPRVTTVELTRGRQVTVASPSYVAARGQPETPDALAGHVCLISRFGPDWLFEEAGERRVTRVAGPLVIRNGDALREAACVGLGLATGTWWLFRKELEAGRLVSLLDAFQPPAVPVCAYYPSARPPALKVRLLVDFLIEVTRP